MDFNYEIINKEFNNDKVWVVILKFSNLTTLKIIVEFDQNLNLKIFNLSNNKFEQFQISKWNHHFKTWHKFISNSSIQ